MTHLRGLSIATRGREEFPFSVAALRDLELELRAPVTVLVGENGTGKSTLLEGIACATGSIAVGSSGSIDEDRSLDAVRPLAKAMKLVWNRPTHRGFFMRAEDFFGFVNRVKTEQAAFEREAARVRAENADMGPADLARMLGAYTGSAGALADRYGSDMDAMSHGEQFLAFFRSRLVPKGLYLLDEPEVALSPTSQLAFLALLIDAAGEEECQFLIATHSPILMAMPGADILSFDGGAVDRVDFDEVEHVRLTREFLEAPERFLRHL